MFDRARLSELPPAERKATWQELIDVLRAADHEGWQAHEHKELIYAHARARNLRLSTAQINALINTANHG